MLSKECVNVRCYKSNLQVFDEFVLETGELHERFNLGHKRAQRDHTTRERTSAMNFDNILRIRWNENNKKWRLEAQGLHRLVVFVPTNEGSYPPTHLPESHVHSWQLLNSYFYLWVALSSFAGGRRIWMEEGCANPTIRNGKQDRPQDGRGVHLWS